MIPEQNDTSLFLDTSQHCVLKKRSTLSITLNQQELIIFFKTGFSS